MAKLAAVNRALKVLLLLLLVPLTALGTNTYNILDQGATSINKVTITAPATGATLTILDGKTFTASNTLNLAGTDGTTMTFPATSATIARIDAANTFVGTQTYSGQINGNGAGVNYLSGTTAFGGAVTPATTVDVRGEISIGYNVNYGARFYNQDRSNWSFIGDHIATGSATANLVLGSGGGTALTIGHDKSSTFAGALLAPSLATSSAATTGTLCWTTSTGNINVDTTTTCLLSARMYKERIKDLEPALAKVMELRPVVYHLKKQYNPTKLGEQVGFIADEVQKVDSRFVSDDVHSVRYQQMVALLTKAMQEQQVQIKQLQQQVQKLSGAGK